ncbi:MAG TPA: L-lactate permease [Thermoplasmata archaeon]|nr:L-lactate permease [Thermoplasmata archaeon]
MDMVRVGGARGLAVALLLALLVAATLASVRFALVLLPLLVVFVGILLFRQSGATMAVVGWLLALALAVLYFHTGIDVALAASLYGVLKSFGITIAVMFTMLMVFLMREAGALEVISAAVRRVARTREEQAVFIGIGFGSFVTSLGVVTPSLFPPFLVALGFDPTSAVSIAVLGYNATTSFALLSIPVTLPASLFGIDAQLLAYKICLYLPAVSTLLAVLMLYLVGGRESLRRGWRQAVVAGLSIGVSALAFTAAGTPVLLVGVLAGGLTMVVLYLLSRRTRGRSAEPRLDRGEFLRAVSPWILLVAFALLISLPPLTSALKAADGTAQFRILGAPMDFDVLVQVYTWILLATLLSIPLLRLDRKRVAAVTRLWTRRIVQPFLAYSLFFAIAYIMAWSAMTTANGVLVPSPYYREYNMNLVLADALAWAFGSSFVVVAVWLGVFGAVVGGSEASSNVMFYSIQRDIATKIGLSDAQFLTTYAAHANGGGIASAITPSKINNAVVTINAGREVEALVMRRHLAVLVVAFLTGLLNALFVAWNI